MRIVDPMIWRLNVIRKRLNGAKKSKYETLSIPSGVAEAIERLIEELGFWPSVGAFAREACIR